jgi:DNA polymerase I-like protein with 3'-5' exonuclease and polymerase domains
MRGNTDDLPYPSDLVAKSLETISKKTVSGAQLKVLLYDKLGLPPQLKRRSTGDETLTADSVTLRKLKLDHQDRPDVARVIDLAQQHNKAQKLSSFLYPGTFDARDGRFRFTLRLNTEAGRFASSQAPDGLGRNSQNQPRDKRIRRIMLPEPGHIIVEGDYQQIEGKLCFAYTGDLELIRLARLRGSEFDQHNFVVSILDKKVGTVFGLPLAELPVKSDERQASKSLMHAFQRDMQAKTAVDTLLRQDERFLYTEEETQAMLDTLRRKLPAIPAWHAQMRKIVRRDKALTSNWGQTWDVRYEEIDDDLFRRAYSWKMQHDAARLINQQGFIPLRNWCIKEKMASRIMFQIHDSLVTSCPLDEAYDVAVFMKKHMEAPKVYDGVELSIPVDFSIGKNYGDKVELGELPDRAAFDKIALTFAS